MHNYRIERRHELLTLSIGIVLVLTAFAWLQSVQDTATPNAPETSTSRPQLADSLVVAPPRCEIETLLAQWSRKVPRLPRVDDVPGAARYQKHIARVARELSVDPALLRAVVTVESRYDRWAISDRGAGGLMQLMPDTARQYNVDDVFDPLQNLRAGAKHLRYLLQMFDHDVPLALAAYNAGEGTVLKHGRRIPPARETLAYVPKVLAYYVKYRAAHIPACQATSRQAI